VFHPRSIAVGVVEVTSDLTDQVIQTLACRGLARHSVAVVIATERDAARPEIHAAAGELGRPLRLAADPAATLAEIAKPTIDGSIMLAVAAAPVELAGIGRACGRLVVVGLGPGDPDWLAPEARRELVHATDIVGYGPYVEIAGPFATHQAIHVSDNREEMARARQALTLAAVGRSVAVVSSGDPGVFAMAAAVMEALHGSAEPAWHGVELVVVPGISAAHAAAARAGAPLGHDFCALSLSDNLKPWDVIERRLDLAAAADLVLALYNPASRARPWQIERAVDIIRRHRDPATPIVIARNVGRRDEIVRVVRLADFPHGDIDMRTILIVGSSTTRTFPRTAGGQWTYTPRRYGDGPQSQGG